jgi:hypothetical protein
MTLMHAPKPFFRLMQEYPSPLAGTSKRFHRVIENSDFQSRRDERWSKRKSTMSDLGRPSGPRKRLNSAEAIRRLRLGDIKKVLYSRYGYVLPDDDAGRADLELLLDCVSFVPNAPFRMKNIIEVWAPWIDTAEAYELVEAVLRKPEYLKKIKADDLGKLINLTYAERKKLGIRTIAPADLSPEEFEARRKERRRENDRARKTHKRRQAGVRSRTTYRATALRKLRPWERLGISERTWYRRGGSGGGRGVSANKLL